MAPLAACFSGVVDPRSEKARRHGLSDILVLAALAGNRRGQTTMQSALHAVGAWSVANHVVLGQQACEEKSNEITAIPELLMRLELQGAVVTLLPPSGVAGGVHSAHRRLEGL